MKKPQLIKTVLSCTVALSSLSASADELRWEKSEDATALKNGDVVVWQLIHRKAEGKPYFHPLSTTDGTVLTWLRPSDHVWHRALWFSWKLINKTNYWEEYKPNTSRGTTEITKVNVTTNDDFSAVVKMNLSYHLPDGEDLLTENRQMVISKPDAKGNYHIDWTADFAAQDEVELERTPIPGQPGGRKHGGYAGLSVRASEELRGWNCFNDKGEQNKGKQNSLHGNKAKWMRLIGKTKTGQTASIGIFEHPKNQGAPNKWYVHKGMPYFSPSMLFDKGLQMKKGDSFKIGYRILVESQARTEADYGALYNDYSKAPR